MVIWDSGIKDSTAAVNDDRGVMAPPTLSSTAATREMTRTATMIMKMTIALPAMIESMGVAVLVPHLAHHGFDVILVVTALSCVIRKHVDAHAFEHHRHANVHTFVLGQGRRDGSVVGRARGDVHCGRRGADNTEGDADNIIC